MEINAKVESPCRRTSDWAFIGYIGNPKTQEAERSVPIGVYSSYDLGRASANAWMQNTPRAIRWEGTPVYEELHEDEE